MQALQTQRVLERLVYEGLLVHNQYEGRRWRLTLATLLEAGQREPRILEILPGMLLHRPHLVYRLRQELPRFPDLAELLRVVAGPPTDATWQGIPIIDLQRAAQRIALLQRQRRRRLRWRHLNIRVSETDLQRLQRIAHKTGHSKSQVIRDLLAAAAQ